MGVRPPSNCSYSASLLENSSINFENEKICSKDQLRIHKFIDVGIDHDHRPHARNSYQSSVNPSCDHMAFLPCPTSWIASLRLLGQRQENPKDRVPRSALSVPISGGTGHGPGHKLAVDGGFMLSSKTMQQAKECKRDVAKTKAVNLF